MQTLGIILIYVGDAGGMVMKVIVKIIVVIMLAVIVGMLAVQIHK
jgi:hypothetical protein